jgi:FMN phosphatase YigB (HAD superfamily)
LKPNEVLHVGDDPQRDWEAARTAGLSIFRLDRPKNSLRDLLNWVGRDSNPEPTPKTFGVAPSTGGLQD